MTKKLSNSELMEQGKMLFSQIDPSLLSRLRIFSEGLEIPMWLVIQNLLIDQWARTAARAKVEGGFVHRLLPEFAEETLEDGTERLVTGEALFRSLVDWYEQELEQPLQDQELARHMAELNKYKLPGEQSVTVQELQRRQAKGENKEDV